jgi:hypothetical protein
MNSSVPMRVVCPTAVTIFPLFVDRSGSGVLPGVLLFYSRVDLRKSDVNRGG